MKKIKIGTKTYDQCQHKDDINIKRFIAFKQYAPMIWEKMDSPLFEAYFDCIKNHFNKGHHTQVLVELINLRAAINNQENGYDGWCMCFALITLEEGEDQTNVEESFLQEKVDRWIKDGLTAGQVHSSVLDFMKASEEVFSAHLTMLAMIGEGTILPGSGK